MSNPFNWAQWTRELPNARTGALFSVEATLDAQAGTVTSIAIPDSAQGFRMKPDADVSFAIDEDPEAIAEESGASIALGDLSVGGIAAANTWSQYALEAGSGRTLRLAGAAGSEVVLVYFF